MGAPAGKDKQKARQLQVGTMVRTCAQCGSMKTPQWREGPNGPKTLCNACGVKRNRHIKTEKDAVTAAEKAAAAAKAKAEESAQGLKAAGPVAQGLSPEPGRGRRAAADKARKRSAFLAETGCGWEWGHYDERSLQRNQGSPRKKARIATGEWKSSHPSPGELSPTCSHTSSVGGLNDAHCPVTPHLPYRSTLPAPFGHGSSYPAQPLHHIMQTSAHASPRLASPQALFLASQLFIGSNSRQSMGKSPFASSSRQLDDSAAKNSMLAPQANLSSDLTNPGSSTRESPDKVDLRRFEEVGTDEVEAAATLLKLKSAPAVMHVPSPHDAQSEARYSDSHARQCTRSDTLQEYSNKVVAHSVGLAHVRKQAATSQRLALELAQSFNLERRYKAELSQCEAELQVLDARCMAPSLP